MESYVFGQFFNVLFEAVRPVVGIEALLCQERAQVPFEAAACAPAPQLLFDVWVSARLLVVSSGIGAIEAGSAVKSLVLNELRTVLKWSLVVERSYDLASNVLSQRELCPLDPHRGESTQ